jgi:hypothetical protein
MLVRLLMREQRFVLPPERSRSPAADIAALPIFVDLLTPK